MKGMVKFYNKDKGFGFVVGENNQDYYFNQKVISFGSIPNSGDMIEFEVSDTPTSNTHKEPTIAKMVYTGRRQTVRTSSHNNGTVTCKHCHNVIKPRIWFENGVAVYKLCTSCGTRIETLPGYHKMIDSFMTFVFVIIACIIAFFVITIAYGMLYSV